MWDKGFCGDRVRLSDFVQGWGWASQISFFFSISEHDLTHTSNEIPTMVPFLIFRPPMTTAPPPMREEDVRTMIRAFLRSPEGVEMIKQAVATPDQPSPTKIASDWAAFLQEREDDI